jgi:effector-binding domain-containing protein
LIYEFIFHFQKIENYLNNRGIEFINRKKTTIDMNNLEKKENLDKNDISGIQYNKNNSINNNIIVDKNSNQQNQQIVDVVSGYD